MDQLRNETTANIAGAGESHFTDPAFVKAAWDMHEAKLLAEGGFKESTGGSHEHRYERAEKELFARMEGLGREIKTASPATTAAKSKTKALSRRARPPVTTAWPHGRKALPRPW